MRTFLQAVSKAVSNRIDLLQTGLVLTNPLLSEFGASILGTLADDERRLRIFQPENGRKRLSLH